jgi:16S rRNA (guanine527-N7)-methyltransferase
VTPRKPEAPRDVLSRGAAAILGRSFTGTETDLFGKYLDLLVKWQKSQRLVGSSEPGWIVENLLLDSLLFLLVLPESVSSVLDLGSGAGVPGIAIKIVRPDVGLVLVESRRRRASFLSAVIRDLGLVDARVLAGRAEDLVGESASPVDAVVMRCAGDLQTLVPVAARLVSKAGIVVASGPPDARPTVLGEWVTVQDRARGRPRRFLVYRQT